MLYQFLNVNDGSGVSLSGLAAGPRVHGRLLSGNQFDATNVAEGSRLDSRSADLVAWNLPSKLMMLVSCRSSAALPASSAPED
jgi:hypothetical protein